MLFPGVMKDSGRVCSPSTFGVSLGWQYVIGPESPQDVRWKGASLLSPFGTAFWKLVPD